jgi:uncharacterized protein (DUF697 family)/GTP-binding protein EngB required for normal cell division
MKGLIVSYKKDGETMVDQGRPTEINAGDFFQEYELAFDKAQQEDWRKLLQYRPTILIVGPTGVGKSSLINAFFHENLARVGNGKPVTQNYRLYDDGSVPIRILDTKGWEGGKEGDTSFREQTQEVIKDYNTRPDENEHIKAIWYVVNASGARFQDYEIELAKTCFGSIPRLYILSQCDIAKPEQVIEVRKVIEEAGIAHIYGIVETSADPNPRISSEPFGLEEASNLTLKHVYFSDEQRRAFIAAQKVNLSAKNKEAQKAIAEATFLAFGAGAVPIPGSDAVAIMPIQVRMIARLANIYGFKRESVVPLISVVLGPLMATMAGRSLASNALYFIPGVGTVAASITKGTVAGTVTAIMGFSFRRVFYEFSLHPQWVNQVDGTIDQETAKRILDQVVKQVSKDLMNGDIKKMVTDYDDLPK